MKRRGFYFLGGIILVIILAIAYSLSDFSFLNVLPKKPLPDKYKAYKTIADGIVSARYKSALFFSSDNELRLGDFPPLFNSGNNTVILARQKEIKTGDNSDFSQTYLKLDVNGNLIDSLVYINNRPRDWAGYLITEKGYCSWLLDGDKQTHPYQEENALLTEDSATVMRRFVQLYSTAQIVYYYYYFDLDDPKLRSNEIDKALFCVNGRWIALYGKNLSNQDVQGYKLKGRSTVNDMVNKASNSNLDKKNGFLYMDHFQKEHFRKSRGPSLGSPTGNSSPDRWEGTGYFNLLLKTDTLHFQQEMYKDEDGLPVNMSPYNPDSYIYYFTCDQINFGIFSNDNFNIYLITKKP